MSFWKRTIVIGDIHGCYDEMIELINQIGVTDDDMILSLGDIVDRGNKSVEVYEFFKNRPNAKVLVGNHERKHINQVLSYAQEIVKIQFGEEYDNFLKWLNELEYYHETDEAIIIHAAFEHDKSLADQKVEVLSGSTSGERKLEKKYEPNTYWSAYYEGTKPIIYGHRVVGDTPEINNNTFAIDTGACHGGYLTAIELPNFKIHQVKSKADYWRSEQAKWQIPVLKSKDWEKMDFSSIQRQLDKLAYIEIEEVKHFLKEVKDWKDRQDLLLDKILIALHDFTTDLKQKFGKNFNIQASQYPFKV
jgi:serine/threonine protein phosphatase 1